MGVQQIRFLISFVLLSGAESASSLASAPSDVAPSVLLNGWKEDRPARSDETVELEFWLKQTHLDELKAKVDSVSDPKSPDYGHFLSKEQADALTAPTKHHIAVVMNALRGQDIQQKSDGSLITALVSIRFAENLLGGRFVYFCRGDEEESNKRTCLLRNPSAKVPKALLAATDIITPLDLPLPPIPGPIVHGPVGGHTMHGASRTRPLMTTPAESSEKFPEASGCCFSIGFGALMKPCCLHAETVASEGACKVKKRIGGATGYHSGDCPATPAEAADLINQASIAAAAAPPAAAIVSPAPAGGCCFSFGYGSKMAPCCLRSIHVQDAASCATQQRLGGATSYSALTCPLSASEAAAWAAKESRQAVRNELESRGTGIAMESPMRKTMPAGCCYSFGFGAFMKPCCLKTHAAVDSASCESGAHFLGGASGFNSTSCPGSASEAHSWLKAKETRSFTVSKPAVEHLPQGHVAASSSSASIAVQSPANETSLRGCCYSFGFGAMMKPCCLQTRAVAVSPECMSSNHQLLGGARGFNPNGCPGSAEEAHAWWKEAEHTSGVSMESQQVAQTPIWRDATVICGSLATMAILLGALGCAMARQHDTRTMPLLQEQTAVE